MRYPPRSAVSMEALDMLPTAAVVLLALASTLPQDATASAGASPRIAPAQTAPARTDPAQSDPAQSDPARSDPARSEPAQSEPAQSEPAASDPPALPRPGELPADATPEARAAWRRLVEATRVSGSPAAPVRAFELAIDAKIQTRREQAWQTNQIDAVYRHLAPGYLSTRLASGRTQLRGPEGDWLLNGDERIRLVGREHAQDREQLDESLRVARHFLALTDPAALVVTGLRLLDGPPEILRSADPEVASLLLQPGLGNLTWIEVESPAFRVRSTTPERPASPFDAQPERESASSPRTGRARIGLTGDGLPAYALVDAGPPAPTSAETSPPGSARAASAREPESATLLRLGIEPYFVIDGFRVPRRIVVHAVDPRAKRIEPKPSSDLWVKSGDLRPALAPDDFRP